MTDPSIQALLLTEVKEVRSLLSNHMNDVSGRLARLETVLVPSPGQPSVLSSLDKRVTTLESFKWWLMGFSSAVSVLASAFWNWLIHRR